MVSPEEAVGLNFGGPPPACKGSLGFYSTVIFLSTATRNSGTAARTTHNQQRRRLRGSQGPVCFGRGCRAPLIHTDALGSKSGLSGPDGIAEPSRVKELQSLGWGEEAQRQRGASQVSLKPSSHLGLRDPKRTLSRSDGSSMWQCSRRFHKIPGLWTHQPGYFLQV